MDKTNLQHMGRCKTLLPRQRGASLIEVMVAVVVLSIGLLGLAMLQAKSLRLNTDAYLRSQATLITNEFIEDMRANPTANYVISAKPAAICGGCPIEQQLADAAIIRWYTAQENLLPSNSSEVTQDGVTLNLTVSTRWQERNVNVRQNWVLSL